jgi:hypothetical protein
VQKFKLAVSKKNGLTTLLMASPDSSDGYTPIIGWSDIQGLREFAEMLLEMYRNKQHKDVETNRISFRLIEQALDTTQLMKGADNEG